MRYQSKKEGVCPKCSSKLINYTGDSEIVDNYVTYEFACKKCNASGKEICEIVFVESVVEE